ncbi:MAG: hypothetical protein ABI882_18620 [Acidobacteriota bacterium]
MEAVLFSIGLVLLLAAGAGAALLLLPRGQTVSLIEVVSLSVLLGSGIVSLSSFFAGFFLSGWSIRGFVGALSISLAAIGWSSRRRLIFAFGKEQDWASRILAVIIALQFVIVIWASLRLALGYDGLFIWESKAHLIFQESGSMPSAFLSGSPQQFPQPDYPLLLPLTESWLYGWMGEPNQGFVKLVSPLFYLAIVGILVSSGARLGGSRWRGLIPGVLFFFLPWAVLRTTAGEADIPLGAYYLAAVAYLLQYWESHDQRSLLLIGLLAALLPWVKQDGVILWACLIGVALIRAACRRQWRDFAMIALPGIIWLACWRIFLILDRATEHEIYLPVRWSTLANNIDRVPEIARSLINELIDTRHWSLTWLLPVAGIAQVIGGRGRRRTLVWLVLIFAPMSLYSSIYIFTAWQPFTGHIDSSLGRLLMHLAPVALLGMSLLLPRKTKGGEQSK